MEKSESLQNITFQNKTGTFKVRAISTAQQAQSFENCNEGFFGLFESPICFKYQKN